MRKMLFLLSSMNVGGVEKAFLGLLSTISPQENEVHLGLLQKRGGLLAFIPSWVHIHEVTAYQPYWRLINDPPLWHIKEQLKSFHWLDAFICLLLHIHFKLTGSRYYFFRYLLRHEPMLPDHYDVAVAFAGPSQMIDYYVCEKIRAKEKYGWIHFDVTRFGIDRGMTSRLYRQYKKIFVVSEEARQAFLGYFPQFSDKTVVRYNVVPQKQIRKMASGGNTFIDDFSGKRILTVGRVSEEKGQRMAIKALRLLSDRRYNIRWYFVGEGRDQDFCRQLAIDEGVADKTLFLGLQTNPYGFMRDCDIYVQPSLHEGFCITLAEALCFDRPIVVTHFTGAKEQLVSRSNSIITDISAEALAKGIERFL